MSADVSVVIPALNEQDNIGRLLQELRAQRSVSIEFIVADGGSADRTVDVARSEGAAVVVSGPGRAVQMNAGAKAASAPFLLFLHADSSIEDADLLSAALAELTRLQVCYGSNRLAGHFRLRFQRSGGKNDFEYYYYQSKSGLNREGTINGDQGFLLPQCFFKQLGGFDESLPFLEDQRLARRIREEGKWIVLPGIVSTSARRFEAEGLSRRMTLSAIIMALQNIGYMQFFERARDLYRAHPAGDRLSLAKFFRLLRRLYCERGPRAFLRDWLAVGAYVRENAWQLFYLVDVSREYEGRENDLRFLRFHDRWFAPFTDSIIGDAVTALLTFLWFHCTWAWYELADR